MPWILWDPLLPSERTGESGRFPASRIQFCKRLLSNHRYYDIPGKVLSSAARGALSPTEKAEKEPFPGGKGGRAEAKMDMKNKLREPYSVNRGVE